METTSDGDPDSLPPAVVAAYVARCVAALPALELALARSDYDAMRIFGHRLKGSGAAYGIPLLSEAGSGIEMAAAKEDAVELRLQVAELEAYLVRLNRASDACLATIEASRGRSSDG